MKKLKIWDKVYGLYDMRRKPMVSSRYIADIFNKEHKIILRTIRNFTETESGLSEDFGRYNFEPSSYTNLQNKKQPCYMLTRDGFMMLAMGFTGSKAMKLKEAYINRFNEMERYITELNTARIEFPELTAAILEAHEDPRSYHFSNEMDMINKIVLGMTAKQFKQKHNLGKVSSIRPYLNAKQLKLISMLQKTDIGLVLTEPDFKKRKRTLEWYAEKIKQKLLAA